MSRTLSSGDVRTIQKLVDRVATLPQMPSRGGGDPPPPPPAPDVFIARVPPEGIPGLDEHLTGTALDDEPGVSAEECDIYRLTDDDPPLLEKILDLKQTVYNLSTDTVDGDQWVVVVRERFGSWVVVSGSRSPFNRFALKGTLNETLWKGGKALMTVWDWNQIYTGTGTDDSEEINTGELIEVHDWLLLEDGDSIAAGKQVIVNWINGRYYVVGAQCP